MALFSTKGEAHRITNRSETFFAPDHDQHGKNFEPKTESSQTEDAKTNERYRSSFLWRGGRQCRQPWRHDAGLLILAALPIGLRL